MLENPLLPYWIFAWPLTTIISKEESVLIKPTFKCLKTAWIFYTITGTTLPANSATPSPSKPTSIPATAKWHIIENFFSNLKTIFSRILSNICHSNSLKFVDFISEGLTRPHMRNDQMSKPNIEPTNEKAHRRRSEPRCRPRIAQRNLALIEGHPASSHHSPRRTQRHHTQFWSIF